MGELIARYNESLWGRGSYRYAYYMDIYIGADHRGFTLTNSLKLWLEEQGHNVTDLGAATHNPDDDYPDYALAVAEAVAEEPETRRGIVVCGSGLGMAVAANKVLHVRAAAIFDPELAAAAR